MRFNEKVICGCLLAFSILTLIATIIIVVFDLLPSLNFAKTYIPSECKVINNYMNMTTIPKNEQCYTLNDNSIWWYSALGENDFYEYVVQHKHTYFNSSSSSYDSSDSSNSSSSGSDSSLDPNQKICYQGLFEVTYLVDGVIKNSNISGVWNINSNWVTHYLEAFNIGITNNCFYQSTNCLNVNWFAAKYSIFAIVGICVGSFFLLACFIAFIILYRKFSKVDNNSYIRVSPGY